jgi:hypothetical protein
LGVKDEGRVRTALREVEKAFTSGGEKRFIRKKYKETEIVEISLPLESAIHLASGGNLERGGLPRLAAWTLAGSSYHGKVYCTIADGVFYVSLREDCLHRFIDYAEVRKKAKPNQPVDEEPAAISLRLDPSGPHAAAALQRVFEWQTQRLALANTPVWQLLHQVGLVTTATPIAEQEATALALFGYVPASPDAAPYTYDPAADEAANARHGSLRQPRLHDRLEPKSPLYRLLTSLKGVRVDLRFREDGVYTVVTLERKPPEK